MSFLLIEIIEHADRYHWTVPVAVSNFTCEKFSCLTVKSKSHDNINEKSG
jgi:hypothetical protein